ncbi:S66 peptidase family protein [Ideonella oryzae]|uniref:LD-carboxypeptidase n=1 Tax=Ideonella oryzae TaxID=2937441 RepID=A0ABT1BI82_9BURK|nr:LD-carboxypeptidase [Ideonella oryzae]MCO5975326.1 LD-carboxypeptidase [Ideonella oryzae]
MSRHTWIPPLPSGACLGLVAPAGPTPGELLAPVQALLHAQGWQVRVYPGCHGPAHLDHLAADDGQRLADLHAAWADPTVHAVLALRGGYGCDRLLDRIDPALMRAHAKPLIGYSDLTALHLLRDRWGLPGLHAPMPGSDGLKAPEDWARLSEALRQGWHAGDLLVPSVAPHPLNRPGVARGRLIGGNLTVLTSLVGTPFAARTEGAILFLEDVGEPPYRIDRLLAQLRLSGALQGVAGFLLGGFTEADNADAVLADYLHPLGRPVLAGWPAGHTVPNHALPLGVPVEMDVAAGTLRLLDPLP